MSGESDTDRMAEALAAVDDWPVDHVWAAVVGPDGVVASRGDGERVYALASVTKPLGAMAALVAVEEGAIELSDPAGPEGSTVRHLLAHASGLDFSDPEVVRCPPGPRRISSSAGFEVLARHIEGATDMAFAEYLRQAVCEPLGLTSTSLEGSAGHGASASGDDLARVASELVAPVLVGSYVMTVSPWLGASEMRTDRGTSAPSTCSGKCARTSSATCAERLVRPSYMVSRMVETCSPGLRCILIISMFLSSCERPSRA